MNLIVEQGNTTTKVAVYHQGQIENSWVYKDFRCELLAALFDQYPLKRGILSSVIEVGEDLLACLQHRLNDFILLDENTSLPVRVGYETPQTLGRDRLAAAVGGYTLQPDKDLLIIDAGTAVTYDVVEASGLYLGGNISPGMTTRFRALHEYTKKLPLVCEAENMPFIGTNTTTAIQAGVVNGLVFEMDGYIDELRLKYPNLFIFLTGGHSIYLQGRLKNRIFADINLVLTGLNRILEYNVEN
ncbi:type III pantothenate kinase [Parabacteroides sp. PF5-6]|uniref:type III pantothenate kinase n=1 Tax=Parabacteroides sp. PF5-6 TaxID=1742403 RepID=UPI00240583A2|nr:type III pantothenate kinase [Parabacteroides sp. PF5-6]MDF9831774.1 type III pantothenate kinase [Parabacteroides sp. PF5-6]